MTPGAAFLLVDELAQDLFDARLRLREAEVDAEALRLTVRAALDRLHEAMTTIDALRDRQREFTEMLRGRTPTAPTVTP